jgi:nucleotide-binding universal stress UspA family protein
MTIKRIVVATDGSEPAQRAVAWSAELATSLNAEITAVHAIGRTYHPAQMASAMYVPDDYEAMLKEVNETLSTQWCQPLRDAHVRFHCLVRDGAPAQMILLTALDEHADLIVMGSRGHGGFAELLIGSVAHNVSHHARVPVVVVPPSAVPSKPELAVLEPVADNTATSPSPSADAVTPDVR